MAKVKVPREQREVRRNIESIDRMLLTVKIAITAIVGILMSFLCCWLSYSIQLEDEIATFDGLLKYLDSNPVFMSSYVVCNVIMWGTIGFVIATLVNKAIKYFLNYK